MAGGGLDVRDVLAALLGHWQKGERVALATVVATGGSAPRSAGASMLVEPAGSVVGSVSGGCVEGAVYEAARSVLANGRPVLERFGVSAVGGSPDPLFAVGLTCGGTIDVFVRVVDPAVFPSLPALMAEIDGGRPVALGTVLAHPEAAWVGRHVVVRTQPPGQPGAGPQISDGLDADGLDPALLTAARTMLVQGTTGQLAAQSAADAPGGRPRLFVVPFLPPARMLVFGAVDFSAALSRVGSFLGYRVTVCDARATFATACRFPDADEVAVAWPHEYLAQEAGAGRLDGRTVVVVLTHEPRFDLPLLCCALRLDLAYVGAMGSRRTHELRSAGLRVCGVDEARLARLHSPVGLDLGAGTPEETAVSIAAEIVAARRGGSGAPLRRTSGPLHAVRW